MDRLVDIDKARILFVDDEINILSALERLTMDLSAECLFANSAEEALELLEHTAVDVVVSDMRMPGMSGTEFLGAVADKYPETIRMVLTGFSETELVMSAINEGRIWGYILKPWDDNHLLLTLEQAAFTQQALAERALLRRTVAHYQQQQKNHFMGFVGSSGAMQFVYNATELSAPSTASVFITGASGTGKEVAAEAIHALSQRKDKPFIALNCAAIPSELMESEIFGHVKGAFSGAVSARQGAAELAHGGTLFLDELSEMDIGLQAKLLRFIQSGTFQRVGSSEQKQVDIRFISATNRNPQAAIEDKKLREDLYYRLNVIGIALPPLSSRGNDAIEIARHFLKEFSDAENKVFAGFSSRAEMALVSYQWPGNVRQLRNCIHNAVVMANDPLLTEQHLAGPLGLSPDEMNAIIDNSRPTLELANQALTPSNIVKLDTAPNTHGALVTPFAASVSEAVLPLHLVEKAAIQKALAQCNDNVVKAASLLDVSPSTLYRKIQNWQQADSQ